MPDGSDAVAKGYKGALRRIEKAREEGATYIDLSSLGLTSLPPEIWKLTGLTALHLYQNQLTSLPPEIGKLSRLTKLSLHGNQLRSLPPEIGKLTRLTELYLYQNQLTLLPPEIGKLTRLTRLYLFRNQLTSLPPEIGKLTGLTKLNLSQNQLTSLPPEIGKLGKLTSLDLWGNGLTSPPPAVVEQGTEAVLGFLREQLERSAPQWVSKLLLVGEGGVGKTSLLNVLNGGECAAKEPSTQGIDIRPLDVDHPTEVDVTMCLNAWDFGGQDIYHATHQFFLTDRSLFLLLWHARLGWEAGKLYYWLDTIKARAPDSPVLIVMTHYDEYDTDLPIDALKAAYPQIECHYKVSSSEGTGIEELRTAIAEHAAALPLMGAKWPATWLDAANALRDHANNEIAPHEMRSVMTDCGVKDSDVETLAAYLHDLGDILYYQHDDELKDRVILKPAWVSGHIYKVLVHRGIKDDGILHTAHLDDVWGDLDLALHEHFLRLMERFDLSYRTLERPEISIVVERLSQQAAAYQRRWEVPADAPSITMRFELNTIPAGIPTYFIARSHRFTTHTHWLYGALFSDRKTPEHLGLIQTLPHKRHVVLSVRGPHPHNFFAILRDGFEETLKRFPGLEIERMFPCPGHDGRRCEHAFKLEHLLRRLAMTPPRHWVECPASGQDVDVRELLYGLTPVTQDKVLADIDAKVTKTAKMSDQLLAELRDLRALAQREFTRALNRDKTAIDTHCPGVFALDPGPEGWRAVLAAIAGRTMRLRLYCEAPGEWHRLERDPYTFKVPPGWLNAMAPHVKRMVTLLKKAAPLADVGLKWYTPEIGAAMETDIRLMTELVELLPEVRASRERGLVVELGDADAHERASGAELHALRQLLDEVEPGWTPYYCGGLKKIITPEGHYLWLCEHHAAEYK